jgi:hypothetical protein
MQESIPLGTAEGRPLEPFGASASTTPEGPLTDPRALQVLSTEHWSLIASRSLAYNEAFSRAGMFLSFLSASLIVIGFLIGSQGLTSAVLPVVVILLLADLFIGMATVGRLIDASAEELQCVRGMNRIRHAYREMIPGLEPYFISGFHDDARGVLATYGYQHRRGVLPNIIHGVTTTIGMVATIDAMIVGALGAVILIGLGAGAEVALLFGVLGFLAGFSVFAFVGMRSAVGQQAREESRFPTPDDPGR